MAKHQKLHLSGRRRRKIIVPVKSDGEFASVQAIDYLIALEMLPPPGQRKRAMRDAWLGLSLFLPSFAFVMWKLFGG